MRAGVGSSRRDVAKGGKRCIKKTEREREREKGEGEKKCSKNVSSARSVQHGRVRRVIFVIRINIIAGA